MRSSCSVTSCGVPSVMYVGSVSERVKNDVDADGVGVG
jgi:hypothetical protein